MDFFLYIFAILEFNLKIMFIKKTLIWDKTEPVKIWTTFNENFTVTVYSAVYRVELFGLFSWIKSRQFIPLIKHPYYDGEYISNRRLRTVAENHKSRISQVKGYLRYKNYFELDKTNERYHHFKLFFHDL